MRPTVTVKITLLGAVFGAHERVKAPREHPKKMGWSVCASMLDIISCKNMHPPGGGRGLAVYPVRSARHGRSAFPARGFRGLRLGALVPRVILEVDRALTPKARIVA